MTMRRASLYGLGTLILLALFFGGYRLHHFVEHDPNFCGSCHIMSAAKKSWEVSVHKNINCKSCHIQTPYDRGRIALSWLVKRPEAVGKHTKLDIEACKTCHYSSTQSTHQIAETIGHKKHVGKMDLNCLSCHFSSKKELHVFEPKTANCLKCHDKSANNISGMDDLHCTTCHSFLDTKDNTLLPKREACLSCHEEMTIKNEVFPKDGGPMPFACGDCHKPHRNITPNSYDCISACHETILDNKKHAGWGHDGMNKCVSCHRPHDWKVVKK